MRVKLLVNCEAGRYMAGEAGEVLDNDFSEKYDYKVQLEGHTTIDFLGTHKMVRVYYFYKEEVEVIGEGTI